MPKRGSNQRLTSPSQEDYLKALFDLGGSTESIPTSDLAQRLNVTPASTSEMLVRLTALRLVMHDPYRGASLTSSGVTLALEIVRHHRLLETYLVKALGYSWDEVHEEADRLEHSISERLEERMWTVLGKPQVDPHGDPIPGVDGRLPSRGVRPLTSCDIGEKVVLERVSDREPEKLRAIAALGFKPGVSLLIVTKSQWEGPIGVRVGSRRIQVPLGLARAMFVAS
jgi:DtxR family Mn-dependent transcriptional regulator